jgi:hypothetical protein
MIFLWSLLGLLYLASAWTLFRLWRQGGFVQGWFNATEMKEHECRKCGGSGYMWLESDGDHTKIVPVPKKYGDEPQVANLKICDECGGTGTALQLIGQSKYVIMPVAWPWRRRF